MRTFLYSVAALLTAIGCTVATHEKITEPGGRTTERDMSITVDPDIETKAGPTMVRLGQARVKGTDEIVDLIDQNGDGVPDFVRYKGKLYKITALTVDSRPMMVPNYLIAVLDRRDPYIPGDDIVFDEPGDAYLARFGWALPQRTRREVAVRNLVVHEVVQYANLLDSFVELSEQRSSAWRMPDLSTFVGRYEIKEAIGTRDSFLNIRLEGRLEDVAGFLARNGTDSLTMRVSSLLTIKFVANRTLGKIEFFVNGAPSGLSCAL